MTRRAAYFAALAAPALLIFAYSIAGDALFPRAVVRHLHADGQVAGTLLDRSVLFRWGEPILAVTAVDGDTLELVNGEFVRYSGIDTPEEVDPRKGVQCYAEEAAKRNRELVEGKEVIVYQDVSEKDKYGRWVGFVYLADGTFVNGLLVAEGYGFAYRYAPDVSRADEFKAWEEGAREAGRGLWAHCTVYKNSSGRKETAEVAPSVR